jgi:hypothetical protein
MSTVRAAMRMGAIMMIVVLLVMIAVMIAMVAGLTIMALFPKNRMSAY